MFLPRIRLLLARKHGQVAIDSHTCEAWLNNIVHKTCTHTHTHTHIHTHREIIFTLFRQGLSYFTFTLPSKFYSQGRELAKGGKNKDNCASGEAKYVRVPLEGSSIRTHRTRTRNQSAKADNRPLARRQIASPT